MAEDLAPVIRVQEIPPKVRSIQAASTSVFAVIGLFAKGPVGIPTFLFGEEDLKRVFGGPVAFSTTEKELKLFFQNGGKQVLATRITHYTDITDKLSFTGTSSFKMIDDRLPNAGQFAKGTVRVANNAINAWISAGATIEILNNTFDAGDKVTVNGVDFEQGVDFTPGGTIPLTAIALRNAINASINVLILGVLTAAIDPGNSARVVLTATVRGASGNSLTLAEVDGATNNFSISGALFTGGVDGDTLTVDATTFKFDVDIVIGGSAAASATNIAAAVDALGSVSAVVDAADTAKVNITASVVGVAGNSIVLTKVDPDNDLTLSAGGTLLGGTAPEALNSILVTAADGVGTHADGRVIRIGAAKNKLTDHFKITVLGAGSTPVLDAFDNLNLDALSVNYVHTRVNGKGKKLISVVDQLSANTPPLNLPAIGDHLLAGGDDGLTSLADSDFLGDLSAKTGIYAWEDFEDRFAVAAIPERTTVAVQAAAREYAEAKKYFLFLEDVDSGYTPQTLDDFKRANTIYSEYSALYWPRLIISDTSPGSVGTELNVPNSGAIAGIMARVDNQAGKGVSKAPAGVIDGKIQGIVRLESDETQSLEVRQFLFPEGINPLWSDIGVGPHVDGARLTKLDGLVSNVNERRVFLFCETSVRNGIKFAKHESIDEALFQALNRAITLFLTRFWRQGGLKGKTAAEAFFVNTEDGIGTINPPSEAAASRVNIEVGLATKKPAYFITTTFTVDQSALLAELEG